MENSSSQKVITYILNEIQQGNLKLDSTLKSERELASTLQVARSGVREALSALNLVGIISTRPQGKAHLKSLYPSEFMNTLSILFLMKPDIDQQILDFRLCIEKEALRLTYQRKDFGRLKEMLKLMENCHDEQEAAQLDLNFHLALVESSDNCLLLQSFHCVLTLLKQAVFANRIEIAHESGLADLLKQHHDLVDAMEKQNLEQALCLLHCHLNFERGKKK